MIHYTGVLNMWGIEYVGYAQNSSTAAITGITQLRGSYRLGGLEYIPVAEVCRELVPLTFFKNVKIL